MSDRWPEAIHRNMLFLKITSIFNKERKVEHVTSTKRSPGWFVLPVELRFMIYELLFLADPAIGKPIYDTVFRFSSLSPTRPKPQSLPNPIPVSARYKSTILRTNSAINAEAKPLLYRHHDFHFTCGGWQSGSPCSESKLGWMTKISLHNHRYFFPVCNTALSVRAQLLVLHKHAPRLKSLKIDFHLNWLDHWPLAENLSGLWDRLSYIEARITHRLWFNDIEELLVAIAPLAEWEKGEMWDLDGYDEDRKAVKDLRQRCYCLSRSGRREGELGSA